MSDLSVFAPYFDSVAIYPTFESFVSAIRADVFFPCPADIGALYAAWHAARAALTGNYYTHFDSVTGLPVDAHNNIDWRVCRDTGLVTVTERHNRFAPMIPYLAVDAVWLHIAMQEALIAYNAAR